jgi:hypothetical protein
MRLDQPSPLPPPPTRQNTAIQFAEIARPTLEMVLPVIQRVTKVRRIVLGHGKAEVFFVDRPLGEKTEQQQAASPVDDLRLADQMVRLALVGKVSGLDCLDGRGGGERRTVAHALHTTHAHAHRTHAHARSRGSTATGTFNSSWPAM